MRGVGQFDDVFSWFPLIRQADPPQGARFDCLIICLIICWASLKSCISAGRGGKFKYEHREWKSLVFHVRVP